MQEGRLFLPVMHKEKDDCYVWVHMIAEQEVANGYRAL